MKKTEQLLSQITEAVRACGEIILHADRGKSCIDEKAGHANFVTTYDKKVQQELKRRLAEILPEAVLSVRRRTFTHLLQTAMHLSWIRLTAPRILLRTIT